MGAFFSGLHTTACVRIAIESIFEAPEGTGGNSILSELPQVTSVASGSVWGEKFALTSSLCKSR